MSSAKTWLAGVIKKPPLIFPFIGLGHILWLALTISGLVHTPLFGIEWLNVLWLLGYTICWIAVCDLRKWGAIAYIAITLLNQGLYFFMKTDIERHLYTSSLWMIDLLFCFVILLFYKKFK